MTLTAAQRARLHPMQFACPKQRSFPIHDAKRVRAALSYWNNPRVKSSTKCTGGKKRICNAAERFHIDSSVCPR